MNAHLVRLAAGLILAAAGGFLATIALIAAYANALPTEDGSTP